MLKETFNSFPPNLPPSQQKQFWCRDPRGDESIENYLPSTLESSLLGLCTLGSGIFVVMSNFLQNNVSLCVVVNYFMKQSAVLKSPSNQNRYYYMRSNPFISEVPIEIPKNHREAQSCCRFLEKTPRHVL